MISLPDYKRSPGGEFPIFTNYVTIDNQHISWLHSSAQLSETHFFKLRIRLARRMLIWPDLMFLKSCMACW